VEDIIFDDTRKDLPIDQLHRIFELVGWTDGHETTPEEMKNFNVPFINSTLVISAWKKDKLIGVVRVLSDKIIRSQILDLAVDPEFRGKGIGSELVKRCIEHFPGTEWLVGTHEKTAGFYKKIGFELAGQNGGVFLRIPSKWCP